MNKLISYGAISTNFKDFAKLKKELKKIESNEVEPHRLDCYPLENKSIVNNCFERFGFKTPGFIEIFSPSDKYPLHVDSEKPSESFFIPLRGGIFTYDNIDYPVVPFVLYSFDDSVLHGSNFTSIMIR